MSSKQPLQIKSKIEDAKLKLKENSIDRNWEKEYLCLFQLNIFGK